MFAPDWGTTARLGSTVSTDNLDYEPGILHPPFHLIIKVPLLSIISILYVEGTGIQKGLKKKQLSPKVRELLR